MSYKEFTIKSITGRTLKGNSWLTEQEVKGNIVIAHGMAEHSMRYAPFAEFLNAHGYNVYMVDHIGHGKNQYNGRGVWSRHGFDKCVANLNIVVESTHDQTVPTYVMGHSMGSFMTQAFMERYRHEFVKKIVLIGTSGPQGMFRSGAVFAKIHAFGKDGTKPSKFMNRMSFASYNKRIPEKKTEFDWVCANEEELQKYIDDPDCGFVPSVNFFVSFTENLAKLHTKENISRIDKKTPVLLVAGKEDPVGRYGKAVARLKEIYQKAGIPTEMILYEGMRHEILNEKERSTVYRDILAFIEK